MALYIAHARSDENGGIRDGLPGDQTGREVEVSAFFEYEWTDVFRPKRSPEKYAEKAAIICRNDLVGYNQWDRYSLTYQARDKGWDFTKIDKACATDCSAMVAAVCNSNGVPVSIEMRTAIEVSLLNQTGAFDHFAYSGKDTLKNGDIILTTKKSHTGIIIADNVTPIPAPAPAVWVGEAFGAALIPVYAKAAKGALLQQWSYLGTGNLFEVTGESGGFWKIKIAAKYTGYIEKCYCLRKTPQKSGTVTTALHIRQNAGAGYKSLGIMPQGTVVQICDTKPAKDGKPWHYIIYNGRYGFASSTYIR